MGAASQATITIIQDASGAVQVIVLGEGRAKEMADNIMRHVIENEPPGNFLGVEDFLIQ